MPLEPAAAFQHLDLVAVRIGDEEKPCDDLARRCKFDQFSWVEAGRLKTGMLGIQIFDRYSEMTVAIAQVIGVCLILVDGEFQFKRALRVAEIDEGEAGEVQTIGHLEAKRGVVKGNRPGFIEHTDH